VILDLEVGLRHGIVRECHSHLITAAQGQRTQLSRLFCSVHPHPTAPDASILSVSIAADGTPMSWARTARAPMTCVFATASSLPASFTSDADWSTVD
jgi:hypothetical protein